MDPRRLISLLFVFAASLGAAFPQASLRINNTTGAVQSDGVSELFWTSTANQAAIATALSGGTLVSPTITGTMSGSFTRSGTTTGGTFAATTLTGTTNFNTIVGTSSVITTASSGTTTATTLTVSGSTTANGNTTLGDASGDSLTINAGTVTAPNATGTSSTSVSNIATLDTRYATPVTSISTAEFSFTGTTLANAISVSLGANRSYTVDVTFSTYTATAVPGTRTAMAYTGTLGTNLIVFKARGLNSSNWSSSGSQMTIQGSAVTNTSGAAQLFLFYSRYFIRTTTSGTLSLQGAQNVNDADPTKISVPSIVAVPTGF